MISVRIPSFFSLYFSAFVLNTERYSVCFHTQSKCGKIGTRKAPNTDNSYAVRVPNPSLIDTKLRSTQKIRNQIGKRLCYAYQICMEQVTHLPGL